MSHKLPSMDQRRLLVMMAHPDDECYCAGGTLAWYSAQGATSMVISATRGQAGEIHDASRATRSTLGEVRTQELYDACQQLGVTEVRCWDYMDGQLADADRKELVRRIVRLIREYRPHIVITFGEDGAYGHPDHIAIAQATTDAFYLAGDPNTAGEDQPAFQPLRLYYAHFPKQDLLLTEEISRWLITYKERFSGSPDFAHGLSLFARESTMLRYARDFIDIRWYPPNFFILEQGEAGRELYIILSGSVNVRQTQPDGTHHVINTLSEGDFFGELAVAHGARRSADIISKDSVTCMVFSGKQRTQYAERGKTTKPGSNATLADDTVWTNMGDATHAIDVRPYVQQKMRAIAQHRTQTPVDPDMFPQDILERIFGTEFFIQAYPPHSTDQSSS